LAKNIFFLTKKGASLVALFCQEKNIFLTKRLYTTIWAIKSSIKNQQQNPKHPTKQQ
jgi:hypothetical protein